MGQRLSCGVILVVMVMGMALPCRAAAVRETGYTIGPRDVISLIIVAGGEEQAQADLVVSGQGEINVPFVGRMPAAGLSVNELEQALYIPLERDYFVDPQVHVRIKEYHSLHFSISGAVKSPGMYELDFQPTIMDLITRAGSVVKGRGNVAYILRSARPDTRDDGPALTVDLNRLLDHGDMTCNIKLVTGDAVHIPLDTKLNPAQSKIYVEGRVRRPDVFDYQPGLTALSAVIMAGGFDKYAAPNRSRIIRIVGDSQSIIKIDLEKVKTGEHSDYPLEPGDRIHVPESWF